MANRYTPPEKRLWDRVDRGASDECWPWTGRLNNGGYGELFVNAKRKLVHRYAYELLVGPIPDGLHLDHLCRNRACVNPAHLEPVTNRENVLRGEGVTAQNAKKSHCPLGHPLDGYTASKNGRYCKTCNRDAVRSRREASRG